MGTVHAGEDQQMEAQLRKERGTLRPVTRWGRQLQLVSPLARRGSLPGEQVTALQLRWRRCARQQPPTTTALRRTAFTHSAAALDDAEPIRTRTRLRALLVHDLPPVHLLRLTLVGIVVGQAGKPVAHALRRAPAVRHVTNIERISNESQAGN